MMIPWSIIIMVPLFAYDVRGKIYNAFLGSTLRLPCNNITVWYGPGVKSDSLPKELTKRIFTSGNELHIVNIQPGDEGTYKCSNGHVSSVFDLKVPALVYSKDKGYFRHLEIDTLMQKLVVGSMNTLTVMNLSTPMNAPTGIHKMSIDIPSKPDNVGNCVLSHSRTPYCQNHIRILAKKSDNIWIVCGTNGDSPTGYEFNVTDGSFEETGNVPCSNDPFHISTAVYVEPLHSNGRPHMYYGSIYYSDKTIQRPIHTSTGSVLEYMKGVDSNNWMRNPEFLGSFELKDTVLFFFREVAMEVDPSEPKIYSRVAKVCKKDKGGNTQLRNKWTSFQKARLNCSIPGKYPFYFDILQDVVTVDNVTFYALFTASSVMSFSAICAFTLSDIEQVFNEGNFKYEPSSSSYWLPVQVVPNPRPGQCINNSLTLPDKTLEFIANKPLMHQTVKSQTGKPLFVLEKEDLQQIELHRDTTELIFYVASTRGKVYKLLSNGSEMYIDRLWTAKRFGEKDEVIWSIKQFGNYVYIGTDYSVQTIQIVNCEQYRSVTTCIKDPTCAWINNSYSIPVDQCYNRCRSLTYVTENGYLKFSYTHTHRDYLLQLSFSCPPETPRNLQSLNVSSSSIQLKWLPGKGDNQTIVILYSITGNSWKSEKLNSRINNKYTIEGLMAGSSYQIKIFSMNSAGNSSSSESINVTTLKKIDVETTTESAVLTTKEQPPNKAALSSPTSPCSESWKHVCIAGITIGCLYYLGIAIVLLMAEFRKKYAQTFVLADNIKTAENGDKNAHIIRPADDIEAADNVYKSTTIPLLDINQSDKTDSQTADRLERSTPKTIVEVSETT